MLYIIIVLLLLILIGCLSSKKIRKKVGWLLERIIFKWIPVLLRIVAILLVVVVAIFLLYQITLGIEWLWQKWHPKYVLGSARIIIAIFVFYFGFIILSRPMGKK